MLDRLRSMEVFVAAANTGSFAAAAVQLGMSAQMVARHVLALED
ncbi:MAG: helix-turn-helix domain-containing protein, partial [Pseudomonas alloputida]